MLTLGERTADGRNHGPHCAFYDDENRRASSSFTRVFEPPLLTVLGLARGLVVVLMYIARLRSSPESIGDAAIARAAWERFSARPDAGARGISGGVSHAGAERREMRPVRPVGSLP